uniref:Putative secreted protein n=1 Tax=Xenopsylla cheopis TaxID=163159 RepID=A0A6M2DXB6_XENCH
MYVSGYVCEWYVCEWYVWEWLCMLVVLSVRFFRRFLEKGCTDFHSENCVGLVFTELISLVWDNLTTGLQPVSKKTEK